MLQNRRFDRFQLAKPIDATAGVTAVALMDVSMTGFKVHHHDPLPPKGEPFTLRFRWNMATISMQCVTIWTTIHRLARTTDERPTLSSGLRIENVDAVTEKVLAMMITSLGENGASGDDPYLYCELVNGAWQQRRTSRREQPGEGFTVAAHEDATQVERLCAAYASGDGETRKLIRTMAALSINASLRG